MEQAQRQTWAVVTRTANAELLEIEPGVVALLPHEGCCDTEESAAENVRALESYFTEWGGPAAFVMFLDRLSAFDKAPQLIYAQAFEGVDVFACALVGASLPSRAMARFYLRLRRPRVPTLWFDGLDDALGWVRDRLVVSAECRS